MKKLAVTLCLLALTTGAFAQGLVTFVNNTATLISIGPLGGPFTVAPSGTAQRWVFGLFTANLGTTDPTQFTFSGLYGTNITASAGSAFGGASKPVNGWAAGTSKSFFLAGWDAAAMGHDYNPAWLPEFIARTGPSSYFGYSSIGAGAAGGLLTDGSSLPALNLFGGATGIQTGFALQLVPEPTTLALAGLGAAALLIFRRRN